MVGKNEIIVNKIFNQTESLIQSLQKWQFMEDKIIFTNGCFDIIHEGHLHLLAGAADFGDKLIVGLNSDESIRKIKGSKRPVNNQQIRSMLLASFFYVDAVVIFNEDTPYDLIKQIQPDVLVKGGDWEKENIIGADIVLQNGGSVETIPFIKEFSTTDFIEKIKLFI